MRQVVVVKKWGVECWMVFEQGEFWAVEMKIWGNQYNYI